MLVLIKEEGPVYKLQKGLPIIKLNNYFESGMYPTCSTIFCPSAERQ